MKKRNHKERYPQYFLFDLRATPDDIGDASIFLMEYSLREIRELAPSYGGGLVFIQRKEGESMEFLCMSDSEKKRRKQVKKC